MCLGSFFSIWMTTVLVIHIGGKHVIVIKLCLGLFLDCLFCSPELCASSLSTNALVISLLGLSRPNVREQWLKQQKSAFWDEASFPDARGPLFSTVLSYGSLCTQKGAGKFGLPLCVFYISLHICVLVHMSKEDVKCFFLILWKRVFQWPWSSPMWPDWLASKP